jgi:hypothetical protein
MTGQTSVPNWCTLLESQTIISETSFRVTLTRALIPSDTQTELIACLKDVVINFGT